MKKKIIAAIMAVSAAMAMTACGSGSDSGSDKDKPAESNGPTTLKVGLVPVVNVAPLYLGIEQGFFEKAGLKLEPAIAQTFAANVAAVMNGEQQVGFGATVPALVAVSSGVPLRILANSDVTGSTPEGDNSGMFVAKDSGITGIGDLEGKTVAINALSNVHDVAIKSAMLKAGADPAKVKFLEVALPDMVAALKAGRVDAIAVGEPFVTAAKAAGFTMLLQTYTEGYEPGTPIGSYFASQQWAAQNPKEAKAFAEAMSESTDYALAHPDEARAIMEKYTQIPPEVLKNVTLGTFSSKLDPDALTRLAELMVKTGTIKAVPDLAPVTGQK